MAEKTSEGYEAKRYRRDRKKRIAAERKWQRDNKEYAEKHRVRSKVTNAVRDGRKDKPALGAPCPNCSKKVGLKMNVRCRDLDGLLLILPALNKPTISALSDSNWVAVETIIDEKLVREIIPELKKKGAEGIVEYSLNKIIP